MNAGKVRPPVPEPRSAPIPTHAAAPWPQRSAASRRAQRTSLGMLAVVAILFMAAWAVPPMLDWNRFRTAIAAIAGAELGRTVVIGGDVALRLLPQAVLTANDVTLPDAGDGMSARIASLRLEVGLGPLLAGKLVVRDLVLGSPVLALPWPLPGSIVNPARPHVPHPFAAHVENGTLRAGHAEITGITAAIHGGPEPTEPPEAGVPETGAPEAGPVATFGAEGFAAFDGQRWRFTTALGAPDADGVSAVDLALQGQGAAHDTGGAIQGTLSDGVLQGRLKAAGPDLSLLMPASALAWRAEAPFIVSGESLESSALSLSLGGAPASAAFTLHLAPPRRLDAHLSAASMDLDGWAHLLNGSFARFAVPAIPMRLDLSAGSASLLGGRLGASSGQLVYDGTNASVENVQSFLPGGARLHFSGTVKRAAGALLTVDGPASLDAPDLHATLAWLHPLAPPLFDALPENALRTASLSGQVRLMPGRLSIGRMSGQLDGAGFSGGIDLAFGAYPRFATDTHFDRLSIDSWLQGAHTLPGMSLNAAAKPFAAVETAVRLTADTATWRGQDISNVVLDAATGSQGLKINHASANFAHASLALGGAVAADGQLSGVWAHATSPDASKLSTGFPDPWRRILAPWHGSAELTVSADGPPGALDLQARAEAGELVLEADQRRDTLSGASDTTLTLRHPGAPFLLASLGVSGAEAWLGMGSMALLAHLHAESGFTSLTDLTLDAADIHLRGTGNLLYSAGAPALSLDLHADELALPAMAQLQSINVAAILPQAWLGQVHLSASAVELGLDPVAADVLADLTVQDGNVFLDLPKASVAGGVLVAQAAIDATQAAMPIAVRAQLTKAAIAGPLTALPVDITGGSADLALDVMTAGTDIPSAMRNLTGTAHASLRAATIAGLSLPLLDRAFAGPPAGLRTAVQTALTTGDTDNVSGEADLLIDHGRLSIGQNNLSSGDGGLSVGGTVDMPTRRVDLAITVTPSNPPLPQTMIRLTGIGADAKATTDLTKLQPAPEKPAKKPVRKLRRLR